MLTMSSMLSATKPVIVQLGAYAKPQRLYMTGRFASDSLIYETQLQFRRFCPSRALVCCLVRPEGVRQRGIVGAAGWPDWRRSQWALRCPRSP
jgi:hypothetical protein